MAYTTIDKLTDHFNTKLFTGTGSSNAITGVGFQPSLCWIKNRATATSMRILDAPRGATKVLFTDGTDIQDTNAQSLTSFDSDGFTVGTHASVNGNGNGICSWNWKANGQGSSNTDGTINTTYTSANQTSGVSICTWTGTGVAGSIGHGLNAVPKMIVVKRLDSADTWWVYNSNLGNNDAYLAFNESNASSTSGGSGLWNSQAPTSSVFFVGTNTGVNGSGGTYVAYVFAEKVGFSRLGSYLGNGSGQGSFIYTGFKPQLVIIKNYGATNDWYILDTKRNTRNVTNSYLRVNDNGVEATYNFIDIYSNGFKCNNNGSAANAANNTFIYMAFGQSLVGSNNIPCTAR